MSPNHEINEQIEPTSARLGRSIPQFYLPIKECNNVPYSYEFIVLASEFAALCFSFWLMSCCVVKLTCKSKASPISLSCALCSVLMKVISHRIEEITNCIKSTFGLY